MGWERVRPVETLLADGGEVEVVHVSEGEQTAAAFVASALEIAEGDLLWTRDSLLVRDDEPVCLSFECVPSSGLDAVGTPDSEPSTTSLLSRVLAAGDRRAARGLVEIAASVADAERARALGLDEGSPVLVLTQAVVRAGTPIYLAKHVLG